MWPQLGLLSLLVLATQAADEYHYDTSEVKAEDKKDGQRLVGASTGDAKKIPFVVAWNAMPSGPRPTSACTGSLIAPKWLVSAAHCTEYIPKQDREQLNEECIAKTARGEVFMNPQGITLKCRRLVDGNLEIAPSNPKGIVWMGVNDVGNDEHVAAGFKTEIARIIRHAKSYKGGGNYGTYGGYDITLVNMEQPVPPQFGTPACLPTPSFDDLRSSSLAGYGKYFRDNGDTCMTDEFGRFKYHYCKDSGAGEDICKMTPPQQKPLCEKFFKEAYKRDDEEEYEDMAILSGKKAVFCFHPTDPNPTSRGWCETEDDYYGFRVKKLKPGPQNWGYCSKDCYLNQTEKGSGVLRMLKNVDVLPEDICQIFLNAAMPDGAEVKPFVICVGKLRPYKTDLWNYDGAKFSRAPPEAAKTIKHPTDRIGLNGKYVAAAGTCNGDSGGPIYIQEGPGKYVVTGAVSGGRGLLGKCGGVNNPTHYTRLKMFAKWFVSMLGEDSQQLCWHEKFQQGLAKMAKKA